MWGSRIFDTAETAMQRRLYRGGRRRLDRRKERINMLQSLLQEDIEKDYPNFFKILKETDLKFEDKILSEKILGKKYNIFSEEKITDKTYFNKYPTIYHLRNELIKNEEQKDIRLVYLAIHHIIKYRGNFLYEGEFSDNTTQIKENLSKILEYINEKYLIGAKCTIEELINIINEKTITKSEKKEKLINNFNYSKQEKTIITNVISAIIGNSFDINKIFETQIEKESISFSKDIDNEEEVIEALGENIKIYEALKSTYSYYTLQDILKGKEYISEAFIEKYEQYKEDLKLLKNIYKKYFKDEYNKMFKREDKKDKVNYVAYNGKSQGKAYKKCSEEEFFKNLKKQIEKLPEECKEKEEVLKKIEDNNFLRKLNITENGEIPNQIHKKELEKILDNQSKYYKTLKENREKIISLLTYRIPYYVGPLSKEKGKWSWIIRKTNEKIRPWRNIEDIIDEDETAEAFIRRMTNKCTYLINEDVMPKQSLLYSEFCVLNELNNIKINNKHISKDLKEKIIAQLFKEKKTVTSKMLENFYKKEMGKTEIKIDGLSDKSQFNSNMVAYIDLKSIFNKIDETNYEMCEKLIYWVTIFEDKKILKKKIRKEYPGITEKQIQQISKLKYSGWSRISKELLISIKANDGENIMDKLNNTKMNFMQIINKEEFGINKKIEALLPKLEEKIKYKNIEEIPTSPSNKRGIWQTMCVVKEIKKIMKNEPSNMYIEFARNEEEKDNMKYNRLKSLLKKYQDIEKQINHLKNYDVNVYKELKKKQNERTLTEKMYLYYLQNGKCLYSGEKLELDNLNLYEVDHIIPRTYIKDDSIDNKALVIRKENQRKRDNLLLSEEVISKQQQWWESLYKSNLITPKKYFNLTRRKMFETDDEINKFINRQLVETRQITKYVTNLLLAECKNAEIFSIRSNLTHEFRERYNIYKNRNVNNYHHAHDAYILSIIGNSIKDSRYKDQYKYDDYVKKYIKEKIEKNKKEKDKLNIIMSIISKNIEISEIKKVFQYKDCYISRKLEKGTNEFYNQTIYSPKKNPVIPLKNNRDPKKYGGYKGEQIAYSTIFSFKNKKRKTEYRLIGIPIQIESDIKNKRENLENYIKNNILKNVEFTELKILKNKILKNQEYLDKNKEPMRLCSDTEYRANKELIINDKMQELIYLMNKDNKDLKDEEKEEVILNFRYMYEYLLEKLEKEYKVFNTILEKLKNKEETFIELDYENKKATINGLINLMETGQGNLKAIGLGEREGRKSGKTFKNEEILEMTFIDKSVTGMYERRSKINGVENSCS